MDYYLPLCTIIASALGVWMVMLPKDKNCRNESEIDEQIDHLYPESDLRDTEKFLEIVAHFEGHLNILDQKGQSLTNLALNFVLLGASVQLYRQEAGVTLDGLPYYLLLASIGTMALSIVIVFMFVNRVAWQNYINERSTIILELYQIRIQRTWMLRAARVIMMLAVGLYLDAVVGGVIPIG